jgi:hypothetical protein
MRAGHTYKVGLLKRKLDWTDVLNVQTRWTSRADLQAWFDVIAGRPTHLLEGTVESFVEALGFMRRSAACIHFREPVDLMWLDTQLKTITLGLLHHQGVQQGNEGQMPQCRARVKGLIDSDLLRALKDTLLVRFAEYVGDCLDCDAPHLVSRCQGVYRLSDSAPAWSADTEYPSQIEQRFRDEIPLLSGSATGDLQRCAHLFFGDQKTRYCSDACRFSASQIAKELGIPDLRAVKPRSFRRAEKQAKKG